MADNSVRDMGLEDTLWRSHLTFGNLPIDRRSSRSLCIGCYLRFFTAISVPEDESQWKALWESRAVGIVRSSPRISNTPDRFRPLRLAEPLLSGGFARLSVSGSRYQARPRTRFREQCDAVRPFDLTVTSLASAQPSRLAGLRISGFAVGGLVSLEKGQDPKLFKSADAAPLAKGAFILLRVETCSRP